ncbi:MAG: DUF2752 domain-containing protein [Actinomycetota bacterium]
MTSPTTQVRPGTERVTDRLAGSLRSVPAAVGAVGAARVVGLAGAGVAAAAARAVGDDDGVVLCPIRRITGGWCPGCGASRAASHVVRGEFAEAWTDHPWVVLATMQLAAALALAAAMSLVVRPLSGARVRPLAGARVRPLAGARVRPLAGARVRPLIGARVRPLAGARVRPLGGLPGAAMTRPAIALGIVNAALLVGVYAVRLASGAIPAPF